MEVKFNNIKSLNKLILNDINQAIKRVVKSGWYILGPEVESLESLFASFNGTKYAISVANGTDAIEISLKAAGIAKGDEVITVSHTAVPTVTAIERAGAKPVFVDIAPGTFTMDPNEIESKINSRTRAILPVHLYGCPADISTISKIAKKHRLILIEDCAQAHGAKYKGQLVGTFGDLGAYSFYPTKNMGGFGDGGMIVTNNKVFSEKIKRYRNYGQQAKYLHLERGMNSRLDEIQAAILKVKLHYLKKFNSIRRNNAFLYNRFLPKAYVPKVLKDYHHVYHLYVIRHPKRDEIKEWLAGKGVETLIHYPLPVHLQPAFSDLKYKKGSLPVTEMLSKEILSLPMYVGLKQKEIEYVSRMICRNVK